MFIDFHLPVDSFITPLLKIAIGLTLMATSLAGILYGLLLGCMLIFLGYQQSLGNVISMTMLREKFKFRFYIKALGLLLIKITIVLLMWLLLVLPTILKHLMPDIANDSIFKLFTTCIYIITFPTAIYVLYRIYFAESVLVSKNISPWAAICMSWKITKNNVWRLIWLTLLNLLIILISILPLGIGLLWSIPYLYICKGVAYRKLARMA